MQTDLNPVSQQMRTTPLPLATTALALQTHAFADSHPGLVRPHNEDHFLIANITSAIRVVQGSLCTDQVYFGPNPSSLFVVADGMGGHAAGERASAIAVAAMERFILRALNRIGATRELNPVELLRAGFQSADEAVFDAARERPSLTGMGTTMTAALVVGSEVHLAHAGDSRAYLLRAGKLSQLTRDHTVVNELKGAGFINAREAAGHPLRHMITNAIGGGHLGVQPDVTRLEVRAGDSMLLCTDGLTDMVSDPKLREILSGARTAEMASAQLVQAALEAGGRDNVTALVIAFQLA
jgi:PPM family protein phosphatase